MKPCVAMTLIVMGTLLIMTPPATDYFHTSQAVKLLANEETKRVDLRGRMEEEYRFGCWFAGLAMVGVAVWASRTERKLRK